MVKHHGPLLGDIDAGAMLANPGQELRRWLSGEVFGEEVAEAVSTFWLFRFRLGRLRLINVLWTSRVFSRARY